MKKYFKYGILLLVLVMLLCACGSNSAEQETSAAEKYSLADLYEQTENDNIFRLNTVGTDGYHVENAYLRDGYILLKMRDFSEQGIKGDFGTEHFLDSGKILLFPLSKPDAAVSLELDRLDGDYSLLEGGKVLAAGGGAYTLYDSDLQKICSEENCGSLLGAAEDGALWFLSDDSSFVLHRDGKPVQSVSAEGMKNGNYIGESDGKAYFTMYNAYYGWTYSAIDMKDLSYSESEPLFDAYDSFNGLISYSSEDRWYIADVSNPFTVTEFTKPYSDESVCGMDESYLVGELAVYDDSTQTTSKAYHIYDMHNGGICEAKSSGEISENEMTALDYSQGLILFETHSKEMETQGVYLWDISAMSAKEPAKSYETVDYHMTQERVDKLVSEIYDKYGVRVYYDREHLKEYTTDYDLIECSDTQLIGRMLYALKECMAEYPDGFFKELKGSSHSEVVFCLCDRHEQLNEYVINDASGTVDTIGDTLRMSLDVHYWTGLRRIFLHENTHMMVSRLEEEMPKISEKYYVEYWNTVLNSPDCPSMHSYIWEQTEENLKGVYNVDPDNAWYIDWYSKCTPNEDEARIMENGIYSASAYYYDSPHIDKKIRFLNAIIREAFPCVKNSQEPVFWEQRTGIVDLYSEFPDFAVRH